MRLGKPLRLEGKPLKPGSVPIPQISPEKPGPSFNGPPSSGVARGVGRWNRGAWLFRDSTLHRLEILLDEAFHIPGTGIRFGLDGIIGLIPGVGDVLAGLLSLIIPLAAWVRGAPYVTLVRMAVNLGIGVLVGSVPVLGDIFDVFWKANRRNYLLLCRHLEAPRRHTVRDWGFLALLGGMIALVFAIPVVLVLWFLTWIGGQL